MNMRNDDVFQRLMRISDSQRQRVTALETIIKNAQLALEDAIGEEQTVMLEGFWRLYPEMRLTVGDMLTITPEYERLSMAKKDFHYYKAGSIATVARIRIRISNGEIEVNVRIKSEGVTSPFIRLERVLEMRQNYLRNKND